VATRAVTIPHFFLQTSKGSQEVLQISINPSESKLDSLQGRVRESYLCNLQDKKGAILMNDFVTIVIGGASPLHTDRCSIPDIQKEYDSSPAPEASTRKSLYNLVFVPASEGSLNTLSNNPPSLVSQLWKAESLTKECHRGDLDGASYQTTT
jgi:hypothetical protein